MSDAGVFRRLLDDYERGVLTRLELRNLLVGALADESMHTLQEQIGRTEFLALKGEVARYPWTEQEWTKLKLVLIAGVTERERPKTDPQSRKRYRREHDERVAEARARLRRAVERFRTHLGVPAPATAERVLVVAMWRPDEDRPYFLDGRWAAEPQVYYLDEIPVRSYGGQDRWPMPFFPLVSDAEEYLGGSRTHTACQVGLDDFRRRWPSEKLVMPEPERDAMDVSRGDQANAAKFKRGDRVGVTHLGKPGTILSSHRKGWAGPVVLVRLDDRKGYPRAMRCQERALERLSEPSREDRRQPERDG